MASAIFIIGTSAMDIPLVLLIAVIAGGVVWGTIFVAALSRGLVAWCPKCGSNRIRRSSARKVDRLFPAFVSAHRCETCKKRFHGIVSFNYRRSRKPIQAR